MEAAGPAVRPAGKSLREFAVDLYGREQVAACWHADSRMRGKPRFLPCRTMDAGPSGDGTGLRRAGCSASSLDPPESKRIRAFGGKGRDRAAGSTG